MDETDALEALANLLGTLSERPYDLALHAEHIRLALATGLEEEVQSAREMLTAFWLAGEDVWLPLLEAKEKAEDIDTPEGLQNVLELYVQAEEDYLSIPILKSHMDFLVERHRHCSEAQSVSEELRAVCSTEVTRTALEKIVAKGAAHFSEGHVIWDALRDWYLSTLEEASPDIKASLVLSLEELFLRRLRQLHSNNDETFQSYSSFTTAHKPAEEYESLLVAASKLRGSTVKALQWREPSEIALAQAGFALEAYAKYLIKERGARTPNMSHLTSLYERAIAEAAKRRFAGEAGAEEALRTFWLGYCDVLRKDDVEASLELSIFKRAVRSVPGSGEVWSRYIRFLERTEGDEVEENAEKDSVADVYGKALATNLIQVDVEQIVPLVLSRAGYEKRKIELGEATSVEDAFKAMIKVLEDGISMVRAATRAGDPRLRLEKYLTEIYIKLAQTPESALTVWYLTAKHYKSSYAAWIAYTDALIKQDQFTQARKIFEEISVKHIDWPEAIWDAWLTFEHLCGTVEELDECLDRIEKAQAQVNARRAKEAEQAAYHAMKQQQQLQQQQATAAAPEASDAAAAVQEATPMEVDPNQAGGGPAKRKAEEEPSADSHKRAKTEPQPPLKRDRENCTVFVADLPSEAEDEDLGVLFKDCGKIREIKLTTLPSARVATVEFMERESVPAALTKDKKRVRNQEVAVHLAWQSTLYVTNFTEKTDDEAIREMFSKFGLIFETRWPSKKFKSTRRFCYIQFTSPAAAKAALELHGQELEPGLKMNVYVSNPERKKERTDAGADEREVYVAGLSRFTAKADLEKVFKTYGPIKDIRMAMDKDGKSRGFAFVEFEQETHARAALNANNHELKSRRIAVTMSDARVRGRKTVAPTETGLGTKADTRNRSLRVRKLPPGAQEGLLQQVMEKHGAVKRVEVFVDRNEAVVEFENAADAGKLLLRTTAVEFEGCTLELSEELPDGAARSRPAAPPPKAGGLFVPRSAVSRPRAGLGAPRKVPAAPSSGSTSGGASTSGGKGQDDFRKLLQGGK